MKSNLTLTLLSALFIISSCSSIISKEDCKRDMSGLGLEHGTKGLSKLTDEVRTVCVKNDQTVNLEQYEAGFNMGWSSYCTSFNGFDMGRKGDIYKSFCPPDKEDLFREKFLIGKKVYEKKDQVIELEEKIKQISIDTEKESSSAASKDELKKFQNHLRSLKREIQALEQQGTSLVHTPSS